MPFAVLKSPLAVLNSPLAVLWAPLAVLPLPVAVLPPLAVLKSPVAVLPRALAVLLAPLAVLCVAARGAAHADSNRGRPAGGSRIIPGPVAAADGDAVVARGMWPGQITSPCADRRAVLSGNRKVVGISADAGRASGGLVGPEYTPPRSCRRPGRMRCSRRPVAPVANVLLR